MEPKLVAMVCITFLFTGGLVAFSVVAWKAIHNAGTKESGILRRLVAEGNGLRLLTVALVIECATYLALTEKLEQSVISLFAGIAGFVLGGIRTERSFDAEEKPTQNTRRSSDSN